MSIADLCLILGVMIAFAALVVEISKLRTR